MKRILLLLGTFGIGALLFFSLIAGVGWEEVWKSLRTFSIPRAFIVFLFTAAFLGMGAVRWQKILQSQGESVSLVRLCTSYLGGFSLLFFVPVIPFASELLRAAALKRQENISYEKGMASVIIDRILEVTSTLFVVIAGGIIFLFLGDSIFYSVKTAVIGIFIFIWAVLLFFLYMRVFQKKSIIRIFWKGGENAAEVEREVFLFLRITNSYFWKGIWISFLRSFFGVARIWAILLFFGKGTAVLPGITILGFYYLALLVPVPSALGAHDALQAAGFSAFGLGAGSGAAFALVIRATEVLFAMAGLVWALRFGVSAMRAIIFNRAESAIKSF
jgi:uncharacterized protein (TIRG00374 family)